MQLDIEKIIREYITKTNHMSLATVHDNKPWVCEVHFAYDDNLNLYWRSNLSRRHSQEIADNPHVAGNIVKQHPLGEYPHGIYFEGIAHILTDESDMRDAFQWFQKCLEAGEDQFEDALRDEGHKFYKVEVENWYAFGKFGGDKGLKHKLEWRSGKNKVVRE